MSMFIGALIGGVFGGLLIMLAMCSTAFICDIIEIIKEKREEN